MVGVKLKAGSGSLKWRRRTLVATLLGIAYLYTRFPFGINVHELESSVSVRLENEKESPKPRRPNYYSGEGAMCQSTLRCQPMDSNDKISYIHVSKNAGSSWIQEIKLIKNISMDFVGGPETFSTIGLYPTKHADHEHSAPFQDAVLRENYSGPYRRFTTLRSPRHQVWSLFAQCYYSQWGVYTTVGTKFPRTHPDNVLDDFSAWLDHFTTKSYIREEKDYFRCYHPANYQSRAMSSMSENPHNVVGDIFEPDKKAVVEWYWKMDWVSLTSFFHESKCILYYRLYLGTTDGVTGSIFERYLKETCHCDRQAENNAGFNDIKDLHYSDANRRPTLDDMNNAILEKIDVLTRVDRYLYRIALEQFIREIKWLESGLKRRVLCDSVLDQWDLELAYLNFRLKDAYFRRKRTK